MDKAKFRFLPLVLVSIGFIFLVLAILSENINGNFYLKLSAKSRILFSEGVVILLMLIISFCLLLLGIIKIKNYNVTRWILFGISIVFILFLFLLIGEIHGTKELIVYIGCYTILLAVIVMSLVIKKRKWTKIVLISSLSLGGAICIYGFVESVRSANGVNFKWETETVILKDKEKASCTLVYQYSSGWSRYAVVERVFPAVYRYKEIYDNFIPVRNWQIINEELAKDLSIPKPVKSKEDILYALRDGKFSSFILKEDIILDDPLLAAGAETLGIFGMTEGDTDTNLLKGNKIVIKNSKNIRIETLKIDGMLRFENCSDITISGCRFLSSEMAAVSFDDKCSNITINKNEFNNYKTFAIEVPFSSLNINENTYKKEPEFNEEDNYYKIKISNFLNNIPLSSFYQDLICNHSSYYFSGYSDEGDEEYEEEYSEENYNLLSDCSIDVYTTDYGFSDFIYPLYEYLSTVFYEVSFSDYSLFEYLRAFSDGVEPLIKRPDYYSEVSENELSFYHVNPEFINWWANNMVPEPESEIGNTTFGNLYNEVFAYPARLFVETYLALHKSENFSEEVKWYTNSAKEGGYEFIEGLQSRYSFTPMAQSFTEENNSQFAESIENTNNKIGIMTGFWIRRNIDGSDKVIFQTAINILEKYDSDFLSVLKQNYNF